MSKSLLAFTVALALLASPALAQRPGLGQGIMAGRVTDSSVILQARLTRGYALVDHDLPGCPGAARYEIATQRNFASARQTPWLSAAADFDYIVKTKVTALEPDTRYYYRLEYGPDREHTKYSLTGTFRTLAPHAAREVRLAVVTGMNHFFFEEGDYNPEHAYKGADKALGYPGLASIDALRPDYFVGTGDTVYFDHPEARGDRWIGEVWKGSAQTEPEMRRKYHEQFRQPRFIRLFADTPTYWEVDDHDYRFNDCDNTGDRMPTPAMGAKNYREQIPMCTPEDPGELTYGTFRISRDLQIWLLEGRLYRSPNRMDDGPDKTIWGGQQKAWLKRTLLDSDATFKILISPTPLVGPDGKGKRDNHTNIGGFRHEGEEFFAWLGDNGFLNKNFYIICGDRHWQYDAIHPSGFEEFSCGALVDANSRLGVRAGAPNSTDPEGLIKQPYCKLEGEPSGGFLLLTITPEQNGATATFDFHDEQGALVYTCEKTAQQG